MPQNDALLTKEGGVSKRRTPHRGGRYFETTHSSQRREVLRDDTLHTKEGGATRQRTPHKRGVCLETMCTPRGDKLHSERKRTALRKETHCTP